MSSLNYQATTIAVEPTGFTSLDYSSSKKEQLWKVEVPASTIPQRLPLGATLALVFSLFAFLALIIFIVTLFSPLPYISSKFAFFLFLLTGGLGVETLISKRLKKE